MTHTSKWVVTITKIMILGWFETSNYFSNIIIFYYDMSRVNKKEIKPLWTVTRVFINISFGQVFTSVLCYLIPFIHFLTKRAFLFSFFSFFFHRWFCFHNGCIAEIMLKGHLKVNICQDLVWISVFSFLCIVFVSFLHVVAEHSWFSWFLTCFCFSPCYLFYIYARAMLVLLTSSWSCRPVCLFCHMQLV